MQRSCIRLNGTTPTLHRSSKRGAGNIHLLACPGAHAGRDLWMSHSNEILMRFQNFRIHRTAMARRHRPLSLILRKVLIKSLVSAAWKTGILLMLNVVEMFYLVN